MPIIDHNNAPETPWRPNYRKWDITREGDGTTSTSMALSAVGTGAGAPLHTHEADELIVILKGSLEVNIDGEVHQVWPTIRLWCRPTSLMDSPTKARTTRGYWDSSPYRTPSTTPNSWME